MFRTFKSVFNVLLSVRWSLTTKYTTFVSFNSQKKTYLDEVLLL